MAKPITDRQARVTAIRASVIRSKYRIITNSGTSQVWYESNLITAFSGENAFNNAEKVIGKLVRQEAQS